VLTAMIVAGMDVARLNFAHGTREQHSEIAGRIRAAAERAGRDVAILGDLRYLADGAVRLRVDEISDQDVVTKVEVGGSVASRQGLNLPNVTVSLPAVSEEDIGLIDEGLEMGVDFFALSFVRRKEDLDPVREH